MWNFLRVPVCSTNFPLTLSFIRLTGGSSTKKKLKIRSELGIFYFLFCQGLAVNQNKIHNCGMKYRVQWFLLLPLFWLLSVLPVFGQTYPTGAIIDPVLYDSIPRKAVLLSRSYTELPAAYSLKQFAPIPNFQMGSSCTAWASTYAARTIAESIAINRTDRFLTTQNVFSPLFVYKSVFLYNYNNPNPSGNEGIAIAYALDFLKRDGAVRMPNNEMSLLLSQIILSTYSGYQRYPIADYTTLYASYLQLTEDGDPIRTRTVKKSISEGKPVVIAIKCPSSFSYLNGKDVWYPTEDPASIDLYKPNNAHALCVVGYDDNKYGGAFEIQNSWGTDWGNGGYIWIPYTVFDKFAYEAYEMIENLTNFRNAANYAASIEVEFYNARGGMPVTFDRQGYYKTGSTYSGGTEFRFLMTNRHPAYVYAFSADSYSSDIERIFPLRGVSPVLDYTDSTVAWPGEYNWMRLDDNAGTDYLVVLFSKQALDIDAIQRRFASERGAFPQRVQRAVGRDFIPYANAEYNGNRIEFSAQSPNPKAVFGLLLAIDHN
jgi:hypothetical protein